MRENRPYGLEGGESGSTGLPYPYPWQWIASTWQRMPTTIRCLAPGYQDLDIGNSWLRSPGEVALED
jgi:hypothetical protein